jgi:hypothetical protein
VRPRVPTWFLIGLATVIVVGAAAAGTWYASTRDAGPPHAGRAGQQETGKGHASGAEFGAAPEACEQQLSDLLRELEELQSRIRRVGANYAHYVEIVMDVSSGYGQASIRELKRECVFSLGVNARDALDAFLQAANVWSECTVDVNCDIDSIDTELQTHRNDAAAAIRPAEGNGS